MLPFPRINQAHDWIVIAAWWFNATPLRIRAWIQTIIARLWAILARRPSGVYANGDGNGNRLEERVAVLGTADRQFVISYLGHVFRGRIIVAPRIRSRAIGNDLTTEASFLAPFIPSSERKFPLLLAKGWREVWWGSTVGKLWIITGVWECWKEEAIYEYLVERSNRIRYAKMKQ